MSLLPIDEVVIDLDIYPRSQWSDATVDRYADAISAGETFPPIALEAETNRLLDGMHRYRAHRQLGLADIAVEHHEIPAGVPPKLYAAGLSARHGDRMATKDLQAVARETIHLNPEYSMATVAKYCGVTRQTVGKWVSDITERRRLVRKVKALLLTRLGWTTREIGELLAVEHSTVVRDVSDDISHQLTEDVLRDALADLPDECADIAEQLREERIFASWSDDERSLLKQLRDGYGQTIVVTLRGEHDNLISWAESAGLFVRIDRRTEWGNPFELPADGDRATVIGRYAEHYLPYKPPLLAKVNDLQGKVLGCWCAPEPCHGHVLRWLAEANGDQAPTLADELAAMLDAVRTMSTEAFALKAVLAWTGADEC